MNPDPSQLYQQLYDRYGPQHWWPARTQVEMMVGAILVQNTSWTQTTKAIRQLQDQGLLDFRSILDTPDEGMWDTIRPAGYFRIKTKRLKALAQFMAPFDNLESFLHPGNQSLRQELLGIYGIGKETADSIACYAAHQPIFVVDAYTKRLFLRLNWIHAKTDYDAMQALIHASLPNNTETLGEFHALIVRHAKEHCLKRPQCQGCPVTFCTWTTSQANVT